MNGEPNPLLTSPYFGHAAIPHSIPLLLLLLRLAGWLLKLLIS